MQIGNALLLMLIGFATFYASGWLINRMEYYGDFESPLHMSMVFILAHGILFFLIGIVKAYETMCDEVGISYHTTYSLRDSLVEVKKRMRLFKNKKAGVTPKTLIMLAIGFLLVGILSPIAIGTIFNATTTGWNSSVKTVFQVVLPIVYVVAAALYLLPGGKGK